MKVTVLIESAGAGGGKGEVTSCAWLFPLWARLTVRAGVKGRGEADLLSCRCVGGRL
ncbi:MAG: hypothetical protein QY309_17655 [Cyclobacteriaceae bacterium]|nr:MAG: hypothetical protein QY309_17655 [Cyclobacteriaceae bacterium]